MEKKKNPGGQPPIVMTEEQISELADLSEHLTTTQIGDYFGFSRDTFQELRKRDERVLRQYRSGKARKVLKLAKKLDKKIFNKAESGCTSSLIFALKCHGEWSEKQAPVTLTVNTKEDKDSLYSALNDEELIKMRNIITGADARKNRKP